MPWSFITSMTTSIASPPICKPQLPPVTEKGAGALHPDLVRQTAIPLPCRPPKTKPILIIEGTTATHFAESRSSSGIPLSGPSHSGRELFAAASIRFTCSDGSSAAIAIVLAKKMLSAPLIFLLSISLQNPLREFAPFKVEMR